VAGVNAIETRAILAMKSQDYGVALQHFQSCRQLGENPRIGDWKDQRACTLLMAETYLAMEDNENAITFYEEALREVRRVAPVSDAEREEVARLESVIRKEIEAIRQGKPR
jgi:tetratricopeptide (TPR) repeat protein